MHVPVLGTVSNYTIQSGAQGLCIVGGVPTACLLYSHPPPPHPLPGCSRLLQYVWGGSIHTLQNRNASTKWKLQSPWPRGCCPLSASWWWLGGIKLTPPVSLTTWVLPTERLMVGGWYKINATSLPDHVSAAHSGPYGRGLGVCMSVYVSVCVWVNYVCVCVYMWLCVQICEWACMCVSVCVYICISECAWVCMDICVTVDVWLYACLSLCVSVWVFEFVWICVYACMFVGDCAHLSIVCMCVLYMVMYVRACASLSVHQVLVTPY